METKRFDQSDERRTFVGHGHADFVTVAGKTIMRGVLEPGWRWSQDVRPIVGGDLCQASHITVGLSGHMTVEMENGERITVGPGVVAAIPPGHDAWVEGDETVVAYDLGEIANYSKPSQ